VDPSSGVSGGSILGDKTRMPRLSAEPSAYIRPSPSAGTLGGVARKTRESILVCEAAGYQVVLIETVGVGQSETVVADMTDCFLALMIPGAGDELQGIKRGLLELVDVIAVNKADGLMKSAAQLAAQQYQMALQSLARRHDDPPVVLTCSALHQEGVDAVWGAIERRHYRLWASGDLAERRRRQNLRWLWALVEEQLRRAVHSHPAVRAIRDELEQQVLAGSTPAAAAARRILEAFGIVVGPGSSPCRCPCSSPYLLSCGDFLAGATPGTVGRTFLFGRMASRIKSSSVGKRVSSASHLMRRSM
jgi:LAO/AO transport system kinase